MSPRGSAAAAHLAVLACAAAGAAGAAGARAASSPQGWTASQGAVLRAGGGAAAPAAPAPEGFDEATALAFVYYAGVAYCTDEAAIASWTCGQWCGNTSMDTSDPSYAPTVFYNEAADARGVVGRDSRNKRGVVAFRGTMPSSITNWEEDLKAELVVVDEITGAAVHEGFYDVYGFLREDVHALVKRIVPEGWPVYVTGHSLGGALALLGAKDLHEAGVPIGGVYTYGGPRVGNTEWAMEYSAMLADRTWRVTHWRDIVPSLPPHDLFYVHVPREVWYNEDGSGFVVCDPDDGEDLNCFDRQYAKYSVADHLSYLGVYICGCT